MYIVYVCCQGRRERESTLTRRMIAKALPPGLEGTARERRRRKRQPLGEILMMTLHMVLHIHNLFTCTCDVRFSHCADSSAHAVH